LFCVTSSVVDAHIYREDPFRVTAFRNRLDLSLSKYIRHGLVAKLNGKKEIVDLRGFRPDFGGLFMCTSCVRRLTSPRHARLGE
jgi:hypothetical protein